MGCFTLAKMMMVLFNLLTLVGGLTLLATGIWSSVDGSSYLYIPGPFSRQGIEHINVGHFCIVIGALLALLGLLGCCGARNESKCLLLMFFSIILIIFIGEVAAAVVTLVYSSSAEVIFRTWATPALQKTYGNNVAVTKPGNTTMTEACFEQILESLKEHANIVGGIAAGIGIFQIAALILSMYLYCGMNKREN